MFNIGCHLSTSKGYYNMGNKILDIGGNTFQFFSRNPRGSSSKKIDKEDIKKLENLMQEKYFAPILAHAPYVLNMAAQKNSVYEFSKKIFREDLEKLEKLPCNLYTFHPGNHTGKGVEYGMQRILRGLEEVMFKECSTNILFENMCGKGTEIGKSLEELKFLLENVVYSEKFGICLDTCHLWESGYDLRNNLNNIIKEIDDIIGIDKVKAIHLNDSKNCMGAKKDRHEKIGYGYLGLETFFKIITHPLLKDKSFYLETPNDEDGYRKEIMLLRNLRINGYKK